MILQQTFDKLFIASFLIHVKVVCVYLRKYFICIHSKLPYSLQNYFFEFLSPHATFQ